MVTSPTIQSWIAFSNRMACQGRLLFPAFDPKTRNKGLEPVTDTNIESSGHLILVDKAGSPVWRKGSVRPFRVSDLKGAGHSEILGRMWEFHPMLQEYLSGVVADVMVTRAEVMA